METLYIIIALIIVIIIITIIYQNKETFKKALNMKEYMDVISFDEDKQSNMNKLVNQKLETEPQDRIIGQMADLDINWKNSAGDEYKAVSYLDGERAPYTSLDAQDSYETQLAESIDYANKTQNDKFVPNDNGDGNYAGYQQQQKDFSVKELMDADKLLPQEEKDWFNTIPEPIKVKNRHLININRPVGIDSVGSSMKIACRDLRGNIPAPKMAISPFLNSSVEPDVATVGFCNTSPYQ